MLSRRHIWSVKKLKPGKATVVGVCGICQSVSNGREGRIYEMDSH